MERIVVSDNVELMSAYESQIKKLAKEKIRLREQIAPRQPTASFEDTYRTAMSFLANPRELWASERLEDERLVLRQAFAGTVTYIKNDGYRAA